MSDHSKAFVPLESWCFHSPEIRHNGRSVDMGLFCEALIFYDNIYVNLTNQPQFAEFLSWFKNQSRFGDLIAMFRDGTITIYEYSFHTGPVINPDGSLSLINIQDELQARPGTFEERFLYHKDIQAVTERGRHREQLYKSLRNKVIEAKAEQFGPAIDNARTDFLDERRNALIGQVFLDEIYPMLNLGEPPQVESNLIFSGNQSRITTNIDLNDLSQKLGQNLNLNNGTFYAGAAVCNRILWTAADLGCDLCLGPPMSFLVGDKLYESGKRSLKISGILDDLHVEVEFPDIRKLVNSGQLKFEDIILFRKKAMKFRRWLHEEVTLNQNALIAYLHDVAKESGWTKAGRRALSMLSVLVPTVVSGVAGTAISGETGTIVGSAVGATGSYLLDIGSKFKKDWRPVVFGNWAKNRIEKILQDQESSLPE